MHPLWRSHWIESHPGCSNQPDRHVVDTGACISGTHSGALSAVFMDGAAGPVGVCAERDVPAGHADGVSPARAAGAGTLLGGGAVAGGAELPVLGGAGAAADGMDAADGGAAMAGRRAAGSSGGDFGVRICECTPNPRASIRRAAAAAAGTVERAQHSSAERFTFGQPEPGRLCAAHCGAGQRAEAGDGRDCRRPV